MDTFSYHKDARSLVRLNYFLSVYDTLMKDVHGTKSVEVDRFVSCVVLSTIGEDNRLATYPQDLSQCDFSFFQNLKKDD